jgi:NAD(P)-dependent dehydrogenase (short-subunit alcohol dehydrogenase family)
MPYSVTKAAQLHLMRCLASTQGPKIRVNAVLPGFLRTEWVSILMTTLPGARSNDDTIRERDIRRIKLRICERKPIFGKT